MGEGERVLINPDLSLRKKKASILLPCFRNKLYKLYRCDILTLERSLYHILRQKKKEISNAKSCTNKFLHQSRILLQNDALVKGLRIKILYLS